MHGRDARNGEEAKLKVRIALVEPCSEPPTSRWLLVGTTSLRAPW